jgi:hypothetical protein
MDLSALLDHYQTLLPWNLARTKCFVNMILGLIASGSVQQHKTSLGFMGIAKQKSVCARIRGFLKTFDFNFPDYAAAILEMTGLKGPLTLSLDRTNWKFGRIDINLLVLAVVVANQFSIPILWQALPKKGNSNTQERIDLLQIFIDVFGAQRIAALTADREFIGKAWIDYLIKYNIPFYIRIKENRLVEWGEEMRHIAVFFQHLKIGKKRHIQFNLDGHLLFFAGTRSKKGELVIVMSNQDKGLKILKIYKRRWTIELLFANCKKNGFNLEDTHLIHLQRIEKLFAVVCSALLLCFMAGKVEEKEFPTPFKKTINTPSFSTFRRGFDFLRKILIQTRNLALKLILSLLKIPQKTNKLLEPQKIIG